MFGIDGLLSLALLTNIALRPADWDMHVLAQLFFQTDVKEADLPSHLLPPRSDYEQAVGFYENAYLVREIFDEGGLTFDECVAKVSTLELPEYLEYRAEQHTFADYGERWPEAFCDDVELNDIFFQVEPKLD